jgi:integrase
LPKKKSREIRPLDQDEAKLFLECTGGDRLAAFFELALSTGMRPGELCGLKWEDVDLEQGTISVQRTLVRDRNGWYLRDPKTARGKRLIPIPEQTVDALRAHKARQAKERMKHAKVWRDHGFVFSSVIGEPLERHNIINRHFKPILMKVATELIAGDAKNEKIQKERKDFCRGIRLYELRHTSATLMLAAGVNPKIVSERLGHASVVITLDTYSHVLPSMQEDAARQIATLIYS